MRTVQALLRARAGLFRVMDALDSEAGATRIYEIGETIVAIDAKVEEAVAMLNNAIGFCTRDPDLL